MFFHSPYFSTYLEQIAQINTNELCCQNDITETYLHFRRLSNVDIRSQSTCCSLLASVGADPYRQYSVPQSKYIRIFLIFLVSTRLVADHIQDAFRGDYEEKLCVEYRQFFDLFKICSLSWHASNLIVVFFHTVMFTL